MRFFFFPIGGPRRTRGDGVPVGGMVFVDLPDLAISSNRRLGLCMVSCSASDSKVCICMATSSSSAMSLMETLEWFFGSALALQSCTAIDNMY